VARILRAGPGWWLRGVRGDTERHVFRSGGKQTRAGIREEAETGFDIDHDAAVRDPALDVVNSGCGDGGRVATARAARIGQNQDVEAAEAGGGQIGGADGSGG